MSGDLHCHTRLSDGSLGIEDLIIFAKKKGLETIAITDHDCLAGTVRGKIIGTRHGVQVIPGVELSATDEENNKNVHILCYLPDAPDMLEGLCKRNSLARKKAAHFMMLQVAKRYPITTEFIMKCATGSTNLYKKHMMQALIECGYTNSFNATSRLGSSSAYRSYWPEHSEISSIAYCMEKYSVKALIPK